MFRTFLKILQSTNEYFNLNFTRHTVKLFPQRLIVSRLEIDAIDVDEKSKRDKFERMEQVNESGIR